MSALLAAEEVSKIYQMGSNSVAALDNVSLTVDEGEFVAIQGTSGSGCAPSARKKWPVTGATPWE